MKQIVALVATALLFLTIPALAQISSSQATAPSESTVDLPQALAAAMSREDPAAGDTPSQIESCPGCCSSHGGITQSCASNGHVRCTDGTTSPSCSCSSCGVAVTPTCTGGQYWNGAMCVCPSGQSLVGGVCTTPVHTCSGGQSWNGAMCVCPAGQSLVGGVCTTPVHTCSGGQTWNGSACACPRGEDFVAGQCTAPAASFSIGPGISGTWVADGSEAGFGIEVLSGGRLLAEWYSYLPNGGQAYVGGVGPYTGNRSTIAGFQTVGPGAMLTPNFIASEVHSELWGTMTFTFTDCNHGTVSWEQSAPSYLSGSLNIGRLTIPLGLTCP